MYVLSASRLYFSVNILPMLITRDMKGITQTAYTSEMNSVSARSSQIKVIFTKMVSDLFLT